MLSLEFQNFIYFLNNVSFLAMSDPKKIPFTPLKSPLSPTFSKYHADVILSRLRDTLDITENLREVSNIQAVRGKSHLCDNITQT